MHGSLTNKEIDDLLNNEVVGRIGCYANDKLYLVPITYVYQDGIIYGHSHEGMKIDMMRKNPRICFEVDSMNGLNNWKSVIIWGEYKEIKNKEEKADVFELLTDRFSTFDTATNTRRPTYRLPEPHPQNVKLKAIAFQINIKEKTGRFETLY